MPNQRSRFFGARNAEQTGLIEPVLIGEAAGIRSATAAGLVLGAQVPIILSSRADPPEARMAAVAQAMMV